MEIIPVTVNFEDFAGFVDDGIVIFATVVAYMKLPQSSKDVIAGYPDVRIGDAREYGAC